MASELGGRLAALEENAYTVGDGSGKPLRIAHASSGITTVTAATGSTTSFKAADIKAAFKALPAAYRPFASWLFHPDDFRGVGGASRHRRRARVPDAARGAADVVRPARADPPETCRRRRRMRARRLSVTSSRATRCGACARSASSAWTSWRAITDSSSIALTIVSTAGRSSPMRCACSSTAQREQCLLDFAPRLPRGAFFGSTITPTRATAPHTWLMSGSAACDARMMPTSAVLYDAIIERRITLRPPRELAQHAAAAIAKHTRRGWRIDNPTAASTSTRSSRWGWRSTGTRTNPSRLSCLGGSSPPPMRLLRQPDPVGLPVRRVLAVTATRPPAASATAAYVIAGPAPFAAPPPSISTTSRH